MNLPSVQSDVFGFPTMSGTDVQIFAANTGSISQTWHKPRGKTMAMMIAVGGGGGGGGGFTRTAGSAGGGGGGGACSGIGRLLIPTFNLPDILYVTVGRGGTGGAAGAAGTAGGFSGVALGRTFNTASSLLAAFSGAPGGGGGGTGAAAGTAGAVPTTWTPGGATIAGIHLVAVGLVGVAGGVQTGAVGASVSAWNSLPLSPGAGGAGCTTTDFAGGAITGVSLGEFTEWNFPASAGGLAAGGVSPGGNGNPGIKLLQPFYNTGGSGGASNNSGQAGSGGRGGVGSGGGGGGAGATGGAGGAGGDGIVMIFSW